jgi:hypothetical protein
MEIMRKLVRRIVWHFRLPLSIAINRIYTRKLIKKIQKQKQCKVAFLVITNCQWNAASLYKKLKSDKRFIPMILVIAPEKTAFENDTNYLFFKQLGYNVFTIANTVDLREHKPDMIFYQQPWFAYGLRNFLSPLNVSRYALCLYFPYGIAPTIEQPVIWHQCKLFFSLLYKQFLFNTDCVREYKSRGLYNVVATGNPQLDAYTEPIKNNLWQDLKKIKIIYAPHHFFEVMKNATFAWNGKQILQMAKDNPNTEWIFKPHPSFKKAVVEAGIMTPQETDAYYLEWENVGQIYGKGDYISLFRTSDLMITDCIAFLTEYLPTGNPVMHLIPPHDIIISSVHQKSSRYYYKVQNLTELEQVFDMLVKRGEDPLKIERQKDAAKITFNAAENIYNELLKILEEKQ